MYQFLNYRYEKNKDVIERIGHSLVTESDFKNFMALTVDLYESGFMRAANEYQDKLSLAGIKVQLEKKAE